MKSRKRCSTEDLLNEEPSRDSVNLILVVLHIPLIYVWFLRLLVGNTKFGDANGRYLVPTPTSEKRFTEFTSRLWHVLPSAVSIGDEKVAAGNKKESKPSIQSHC